MKDYKLKTITRKIIGDTLTPVNIYLQLRDHFVHTIMLESSDYHGNDNAFSYICCEPIAKFQLANNEIVKEFPDGFSEKYTITNPADGLIGLKDFVGNFESNVEVQEKHITNGLFGFMSYGAVQHFEEIELKSDKDPALDIPEMLYHVYKYVIAFNHFNEEVYLMEHSLEGSKEVSRLEEIEKFLGSRGFRSHKFETVGGEETNFTDEEFLKILQKGKDHCQRGDVFQIVLSRRFSQAYKGDDFTLYRALRSINPSPYLYYFDFGDFRIMGSSPEAQIVVKSGQATIYPIAGTFKRTGDDESDRELAKQLFDDPKENSEHVMLVDLARNDLSRHANNVTVETFKDIQFYSHVIHLVSKVTGKTTNNNDGLQVVADTFPAGTLSGAPKYMAMELIDKYEKVSRSYYGGCIGFIGFDGTFNHAIMIRSFLSKNNKLFYQAGAGVVAQSVIESELQEVHNKLMALKKALELGKELSL